MFRKCQFRLWLESSGGGTERTFNWLIRWRRLVRDYEKQTDVSEAMIRAVMGSLLLRRITHW